MTKKEFIDAVNEAAEHQGIELTKKDTNELLDVIFEKAAEVIESEERFSFPDFGTFKLKYRKEREGVNPQNPDERITIPASYTVKFKPAPKMKDRINEEEQ
jgi:DNA-binding protein HU-beta